MPNLEIDGRKVEVAQGATVMDAAVKLGIYVPHFCYHKKLSIAANCRMCLVEAEQGGRPFPKPVPACATPVAAGMKILTRSPLATEAQQGTMEFLLINHPLDCPSCDQGGECELQDLALGYGASVSRYAEGKRVVMDEDLGSLIATEMTRCIHCTRCLRFGAEARLHGPGCKSSSSVDSTAVLIQRQPSKRRMSGQRLAEDRHPEHRHSSKQCLCREPRLCHLHLGLHRGCQRNRGIASRGVLRLLFGIDYARLDSAQTLLQLAPISFDAATFEIWGALLHGGRCVLFPGKLSDPREIGAVLHRHQVNTLWLTAA